MSSLRKKLNECMTANVQLDRLNSEFGTENLRLKNEIEKLKASLTESREDRAILFAERSELLDTIGLLTRIIGRFYKRPS